MLQNRKLLLLGAGGHAKSIADTVLGLALYDEIGMVGKEGTEPLSELEAGSYGGLKEIAKEDQLEALFAMGYSDAFIAVGSIGDITVRQAIYSKLKRIGFRIPNIIDKSSVVSKYSTLGEGIYIGKKAVVNTNTFIGNCAIINTAAVIEHECHIGDFVHVASGSILCGNVHVGNGTHIGAGSMIKQGVHIGAGTMIGMGSVVLRDVGDYVTAYGNPCRVV